MPRDIRLGLLRRISEAMLQSRVAALADLLGWWWFHVPDNVIVCPRCKHRIYRQVRKGFPDLVLIKPPHLVFIELKTETGTVSEEQKTVHELLRSCGAEVHVLRPRDMDMIAQLLRREGG